MDECPKCGAPVVNGECIVAACDGETPKADTDE